MTEISILTKFFISFFIIAITVIGTYGWLCVLKLNKRNERLRKDRNRLIEEKAEWFKRSIELSDTERKLIFIALDLPELKKEIKTQGLEDVYDFLKKKIKDSIEG